VKVTASIEESNPEFSFAGYQFIKQATLIYNKKLSYGSDRATRYASKTYGFTKYMCLKGFKQQKWPLRSFKGIGNGAIR